MISRAKAKPARRRPQHAKLAIPYLAVLLDQALALGDRLLELCQLLLGIAQLKVGNGTRALALLKTADIVLRSDAP